MASADDLLDSIIAMAAQLKDKVGMLDDNQQEELRRIDQELTCIVEDIEEAL
jgi:cytochrome c-type biogenesis protein CcmH/NrfF